MTAALSPSPIRSKRLYVRLTDQEQAALEAEARALGVTVSDYVRTRVMRGRRLSARPAMQKAAAPARAEMSPATFATLSRIGNNLNQVARAYHRGRDFDRGHVMHLVAEAWSVMLQDEVMSRYAAAAEAKVRGPAV